MEKILALLVLGYGYPDNSLERAVPVYILKFADTAMNAYSLWTTFQRNFVVGGTLWWPAIGGWGTVLWARGLLPWPGAWMREIPGNGSGL